MDPGVPAATLPAHAYHDPGWYATERHAVFAAEWQLAGFRAHLQRPGDMVTYDVAGWSVLGVLGGDGALRAFHNVCRHRAGPICTAAQGHASALVCGYHGWVYGLDGRLQRARDFGADLDADAFGLVPVAVDEWRGLVFVRIATTGPALAGAPGPRAGGWGAQPIESLTYGHRLEHTVEAN